jgi:hypothetical protein
MSHGDRVTELPPGFRRIALSENAPMAAIADEARRYYAVQFHLEVVHTPDGAKLISNFVHKVAGLKRDWTMAAFRGEAIKTIRAQVGEQGRVLCGLSGGVDSAVAAVLIHEAIGERLTCVFVDHGLMRQSEATEVVTLFRDTFNIPLVHVDASDMFINALDGVSDPETKRKTIGKLFIDVFEAEARKIAADGRGAPAFLVPLELRLGRGRARLGREGQSPARRAMHGEEDETGLARGRPEPGYGRQNQFADRGLRPRCQVFAPGREAAQACQPARPLQPAGHALHRAVPDLEAGIAGHQHGVPARLGCATGLGGGKCLGLGAAGQQQQGEQGAMHQRQSSLI